MVGQIENPSPKQSALEPYRKAYLLLFNTITDVLKQMEQMNFGQAKESLKKGQQKAEDFFLEDEEVEL